MLNIPGHKGNANQNNIEIPPHSRQTKWLAIIKNTTNNSGEDAEKEPSYTVDRNVN
jgi:hypothetical protein